MANNAFIATDDPNAKLPEPISVEKLASWVQTGKKAMWHWKAKLSIGYDPFLVYVWATDGKTVDFSFIDCDKGTLPAGSKKFTLALDDLDVAHPAAPSTDRAKLDLVGPDPNKLAAVVFLMINPERMDAAMRQAAVDAQQAPSAAAGKWPGTARVETLRLVQQLIGRLRELQAAPEELARYEREAASL